MPRFMVEINRRAYELLQAEAAQDRRTPQDQAGILLEQMLEAKGDADALAPDIGVNKNADSQLDTTAEGVPVPKPADPSGRQQKTLG